MMPVDALPQFLSVAQVQDDESSPRHRDQPPGGLRDRHRLRIRRQARFHLDKRE